MGKVNILINGIEVEVDSETTVLQACGQIGLELPVFCYHPKLSIAGNCRMCLVEDKKAKKLVASCAQPVTPGLEIETHSPRVQNARKGVLEFLLINHPLDCPVCDQGGECDLQDLSFSYGKGCSSYKEHKRAVEDKNLGPLIKSVMTRCIHCTRCIRFSDEIAGVSDLGSIGRGENVKITTYIEKALGSELSGNMIDICPVGALTSKPYAFQSRSWELTKTPSIDVHDAVGSNIFIESREGNILRVLPNSNEMINESWISDKVRFSYDGLSSQRLDRPYRKHDNRLQGCSWTEALKKAAYHLERLRGTEVAGLVGSLVSCESIFSFKEFLENLQCENMDFRLKGEYLEGENRQGYTFNTTIVGIEDSDTVLFVGTNPRIEAPLVNARWRKRFLKSGLVAGLVGKKCDLNFPCEHLGDTPEVLRDILKGSHSFSKQLNKAKNPMIVLGMGALEREDSQDIYSLCLSIASKYSMVTDIRNNFNILHTKASAVGALDIGFLPGKSGLKATEIYKAVRSGKIKVLYLLGADDIPLSLEDVKNTFVIYQGHHGDKGANLADLILPSAAYTEQEGTYVNTEGRSQEAQKAIPAPGEAREDWRIFRVLSQMLGEKLPYDTLDSLRGKMFDTYPVFKQNNSKDKESNYLVKKCEEVRKEGLTIQSEPIGATLSNFYMTDCICRHSKVMADCMEAFAETSRYERKE